MEGPQPDVNGYICVAAPCVSCAGKATPTMDDQTYGEPPYTQDIAASGEVSISLGQQAADTDVSM